MASSLHIRNASVRSELARTLTATTIPGFDRDGIRAFDLVLSPTTDGFVPPLGARDDALLLVQGGAVTVDGTHVKPMLLDPTHVLRLRASTSMRILVHSARTRCTLLVWPGERAAPAGDVAHHLCHASTVAPLGVAGLFRFFWLRRALESSAFSAGAAREIARVAWAIRREAMDFTHTPDARRADGVRSRAQRRILADAARMRLAACVGMPHRLVDVARSVHASPFHLAHVFREEVGLSLHQHLLRLRLIAALDRLSAGASDLSALALDVGFSNHSHFSTAFRRAFGVVPSEARRRLTSATLADVGLAAADATVDRQTQCGDVA